MYRIILIIVAAIILLGVIFGVTNCSKVEQGYVGLVVDLVGSNKSEIEVKDPGFYWVGPYKDLFKFPIFKQTYVFTDDIKEGESLKEGFQLQTAEGLNFVANVGVIYMLKKDKVADIFREYRMGIDEITHKYLRTVLRNCFVEVVSIRKIDDIIMKKTEIMDSVNKKAKEILEPKGIIIESINLVSNFDLPESVKQQIEFKIHAVQISEKTEIEKRQAFAQFVKDSIAAANEANAKLIKARAEAEANKLRSVTLTQLLVQQSAINKWNGELPSYMSSGGSLPFIGNMTNSSSGGNVNGVKSIKK